MSVYRGPALPDDIAHCQAVLARGSKSFALAGRFLPAKIRGDVAAVYAFCRVADDAVDTATDAHGAVAELSRRLDGVYASTPDADPVDRALAAVVRRYALPRAVFDALLEGFVWDVEGRHYETLGDVRAYAVRVASTVGVLMTLLMGERRRDVLARAADLGIAMQLTNIARDVGEDARNGRVYLPRAWFRDAGIDVDAWRRAPEATEPVRDMVRRLLEEADAFYRSADRGIPCLPRESRVAIAAARHVYAAIGDEIRRANHDSVSARAFTSLPRKLAFVAQSVPSVWHVEGAAWQGPAAAEVEFLLDAVTAGAAMTAETTIDGSAPAGRATREERTDA
ncbi:MAG: phytoene/squalene synthase family protein [Polyangiales bacterium]|nr:phytoene/squalene synthase family protein [Myxococcales bacterium]